MGGKLLETNSVSSMGVGWGGTEWGVFGEPSFIPEQICLEEEPTSVTLEVELIFSVLFLEGSLVKTLLAHICSFSPSSELEEEIDLLSLLSLLFLKKNLHLTLLLP